MSHECQKCGAKFENIAYLLQHAKVHEQKTFKCHTCGKNFKEEDRFKDHKHDVFQCDSCPSKFNSEADFITHRDTHSVFRCTQCGKGFGNDAQLLEHVKVHVQEVFACDQCNSIFKTDLNLRSHMQEHSKGTQKEEFSCTKFTKVYCDMRKLRRHDWRSHRSIECIICSEMLNNRQEIAKHKEHIHQMYKKTPCKFYPDCVDDDECLFEHIQIVNDENNPTVCPNGQNCSDQSCKFSEQNHRSINQNRCRYQEHCNRSGCQFKHFSPRTAFLGVGPSKQKST